MVLNTVMDIFSFTSCVLKLQAQFEDCSEKQQQKLET